MRVLLVLFTLVLFSSCFTSKVIEKAENVDWEGAYNFDKYDRIDSVYIINDSLMIVKITGQFFYDKRTSNHNYDHVYYTILLKPAKVVAPAQHIQFDETGYIKNNNKEYAVKYPGIHCFPLNTLKQFLLQGDPKANIQMIDEWPPQIKRRFGNHYYNINYAGWQQQEYVYNLSRNYSDTQFPKIKGIKKIRKYGGMQKVAVSEPNTTNDIDGYYFPINNDTAFFYDNMWYCRREGIKSVVIPKQELSLNYCFVDRKDSSYKIVQVNIPRTYNEIEHPAYLLYLPLTIAVDIPLQLLWLPIGLPTGTSPEIETIHK